jgi:glycosyltransferase involved in cell wall biosynthesis
MNIAYIVETYRHSPHGGVAVWTRRLVDYYRELGIPSQVYAYSDGIKTRLPDSIKYFPNLRELVIYPYYGRKAIQQISEKHSLIHFGSPFTSAWGKAKIPTVMSTHYLVSRQADFYGKYLPAKYRIFFNSASYQLFKYFEKMGFQNADIITVCRESFKDYLVERMNIQPERIEVIQYGVDYQRFKPNPEFQIKEPTVLFVGRGSLGKGFDTLVRAAKLIKGKVVAVASQIPPEIGAQIRQLKNFEVKSGLSDQEMSEIYQKASLLVMPSISEGAPLCTLEAMSSGLPVVCTPEGSGDYIKDGVNGYIFDYNNENQLAEKVNYLFEHQDLAINFGRFNRVKVENELTLPIIAGKILNIYKKLSPA